MLDRSTPQYWFARFAMGLLVLVAAGLGVITKTLGMRDPIGLATLALGGYGFWMALTSIGPMTRLSRYRANTKRAWGDDARNTFERASLPRRIFYLLVAVAEADGPITSNEREVVRRFLLQRFMDPVQTNEIHSWEMQPLPIEDRIGLAARIAISLDEAELDTMFCWCCLVAFADGKFRADEHQALHEVARGLDIPAPRARMLFHLARAQYLAGNNHSDPSEEPKRPATAHAEALAVLGLPLTATSEQIRRRHRELVRKFHPDAQPHLGEVAQRKATERFQAIQRAYEMLTANA